MNVIETVEHHILKVLATLFTEHNTPANAQVTINADKHKQQFGDLSCNAALIYAKLVGEPPRVIAQSIIDALDHQHIAAATIAGPGFINISLTPQAYCILAQELFLQDSHFFAHHTGLKESYNIEFVSANPTGPLHIGHGRGGIIGDVLAHVLSFLGHGVTKEYYINDAGAQMKKLGTSFRVRCMQVMGEDTSLPKDGYQGAYLAELAQHCYETHGDELKSKDEHFFESYAEQALLEKIRQTLSSYGITYDTWFSEKTLHASGAIAQVLDQLSHTDHLYTDDEGTTWLKATSFGDDKDRVVRKKTGELTYIAADIAYTQDKVARSFDHLIYILGQDHHSYVIRLKAVMQALGYDPARLDVILYQLVTVKEQGQDLRLSKRAGRIVSLKDIISAVGTDVARFFYLHKKADAHLEFDLELALTHTEENPVYYVQYAYVRTKSIQEKARQYEELHAISADDSAHIGPSEQLILKKIALLKELLQTISRNYQTHLLTYYAIELAQTFHAYYGSHKVIDPNAVAQSRARLMVIGLVGSTLKTCFDLLGISAPDRM